MDKVFVRKAMAAAWAWDGLLPTPLVGVREPLPMKSIESPDASITTSDEDADCARRACGGDSAAFDLLIARYAPRMYTHIYRMIGHREEAEDLVQETFLRAYRYLGSYDPSRSFRTWIYAIATNVSFNAIRSRKRGGLAFSLDDDERENSWQEPAATLADGRELADRRDLNTQITAAVRRLPAQSAALVHMHYFEGMAIRDAAEACGISEAAAKVALHRARRKLREWLVDREP
ncbi:MAG: RNA polymerase sigma24 factor [Candidatus Hydrogenedentota bacterium]